MLQLDEPLLPANPETDEQKFQGFYANVRETRNLSYITACLDIASLMGWSLGIGMTRESELPK